MLLHRRIVNKLDLKKETFRRIGVLLFKCKYIYNIDIVYFNKPIDGVTFWSDKPHYSLDTSCEWYDLSGYTLIKIIKCLKNKQFYGYSNKDLMIIEPNG
jgi:hypothetical protein